MVRVGGGWDTLEHFLDKHDPCRCRFGHRETLAGQVRMERPAGDHQMIKQVRTIFYHGNMVKSQTVLIATVNCAFQVEFKRIMAPTPAPKEPWK